TAVALLPPAVPDTAPQDDPSRPLLPSILARLALASDWTCLQIHTHAPPHANTRLPRALLSAYGHNDLYPEPHRKEKRREWVLPCSLDEKLTLRRWAEVFDLVGVIPPELDGEGRAMEVNVEGLVGRDTRKRMIMGIVGSDGTV